MAVTNKHAPKYRKQSLGRAAYFLIPSLKLKTRMQGKHKTVETYLHKVLMREFGSYTAESATSYGYWTHPDGHVGYSESRAYRVAFEGKHRVPIVEELVARIAQIIGEKCIYLEIGEDVSLIYALED